MKKEEAKEKTLDPGNRKSNTQVKGKEFPEFYDENFQDDNWAAGLWVTGTDRTMKAEDSKRDISRGTTELTVFRMYFNVFRNDF